MNNYEANKPLHFFITGLEANDYAEKRGEILWA